MLSFPPYHGSGFFFIGRRLCSSDMNGDIVGSMCSFSNSLSSSWIRVPFHGRSMWRVCCRKEGNLNGCEGLSFEKQCGSLIKPVVNAELNGLLQLPSEDSAGNSDFGVDSAFSGDHSFDVDDMERLRRRKISEANKGKVPWNKGRKHSAETIRRIRERTKIAMQDPKVKMKLTNLGHPQSEETRVKIGIGIRQGWQRRRRRFQVQEKCFFEWQNIIAEASRIGCVGEQEVQWNSYEILKEQLNQEWLESIEKRKTRPKGSRRAPKSLEQRRKISLAIAAKWADQRYRERVCLALAKYHGKSIGAQTKPRKNSAGEERKTKKATKLTEKVDNVTTETKGVTSTNTKNTPPSYTDLLSDFKLAFIKQIKVKREAMENQKKHALARAKLLITEAEKAADALELFAEKSPSALASLMEARKMVAEAKQTIGSVDTRELKTQGNGHDAENLSSDQSMYEFPSFDNSLREPENAGQRADTVNHRCSKSPPAKTRKNWVCGRLVEVQED
ncbi:GHMP kinase C-terminal domain-containing protein [Dioscorea alata]|uniref:GHMP kinase C-terminal domain-containing protein n=1 Tax=Dioscorea alata TaxID=55571 RepID=A0ACB7VMZ8_DIOAL|nr:GHMP kinase C-terminal domain-containing protein [Dioscorea alata]